MPYLSAIAQFRDQVRNLARGDKNVPLLQLCDQFRDDILPELGVKLEDLEGEDQSSIKLADRETLLREKQEKIKVHQS